VLVGDIVWDRRYDTVGEPKEMAVIVGRSPYGNVDDFKSWDILVNGGVDRRWSFELEAVEDASR
jgi:hypothetical protein